MKKLVQCPNCANNGIKSILGELGTSGNFLILRFHRGYTEITGKDYGVICGNCREPVYIRKEADDRKIRSEWQFGISWGTDVQSFGTISV